MSEEETKKEPEKKAKKTVRTAKKDIYISKDLSFKEGDIVPDTLSEGLLRSLKSDQAI